MEKQNWEENEFQKQVRMSERDWKYLKRIKGKTTIARKLQEIVKFYEEKNIKM